MAEFFLDFLREMGGMKAFKQWVGKRQLGLNQFHMKEEDFDE
jgi:hypothetical protein